MGEMVGIRRFLAITLMVQFAGAWSIALKKGTALHTTLFLNLDLPDLTARWLDQGFALTAIVMAGICLWRPSRALAGLLVCYTLTLAGCAWLQGASYFAGMTIPAWSARMAAPMLLLWSMSAHPRARDGLMWTARLGVAVTFAAHGVEAMLHQPSFQNLIMASGYRWTGAWVPQEVMERALDVIGFVDILVAVLLMSGRRWKILAIYMSMWGFVTAMSRMTAWGWSGTHATALRIAHGMLPLLLVWMWRQDEANDAGRGVGDRGDDERDSVGASTTSVAGHLDGEPRD